MNSKYFTIKTKETGFEEHLLDVLDKLKNKNVIIFGANEEFKQLNKQYKIQNKLNIIAFTDNKFKKTGKFMSFKAIEPYDIEKEDYDAILIVNGEPEKTLEFLRYDLLIKDKIIETVFVEELKDECANIDYLYKYKFDKTLPKLMKKLKNKTVMLYGAGAFLELIKKFFDLSPMNIIGIADMRFEEHEEDETFLGYKVYSPYEIRQINPDYVIVATKFYLDIMESLYYDILNDTKIKIKPLLKKGFFDLLKEI